MSVAVSAAAISASNAAVASAAAHAAKVDRCKMVIGTFDSRGASVVQMQEYAACVDTVYPLTSSDSIIWYKALFVIALVGMGLGIWKTTRDVWGWEWPDMLLNGLFGFILAPMGVFAVCALLQGVIWLFA